MCRRRERITGEKRCSRATSPPQLGIRTPSHPVSAVHNTETIGCRQMRSTRPTVQSEDASKSLDLPAPLREESLIDADDPTRVSATRQSTDSSYFFHLVTLYLSRISRISPGANPSRAHMRSMSRSTKLDAASRKALLMRVVMMSGMTQ